MIVLDENGSYLTYATLNSMAGNKRIEFKLVNFVFEPFYLSDS